WAQSKDWRRKPSGDVTSRRASLRGPHVRFICSRCSSRSTLPSWIWKNGAKSRSASTTEAIGSASRNGGLDLALRQASREQGRGVRAPESRRISINYSTLHTLLLAAPLLSPCHTGFWWPTAWTWPRPGRGRRRRSSGGRKPTLTTRSTHPTPGEGSTQARTGTRSTTKVSSTFWSTPLSPTTPRSTVVRRGRRSR
ncbi:unnamed protein product, partial [Ectocarpus sp. 12 AP-2014]